MGRTFDAALPRHVPSQVLGHGQASSSAMAVAAALGSLRASKYRSALVIAGDPRTAQAALLLEAHPTRMEVS